jgi:hypothetical protein
MTRRRRRRTSDAYLIAAASLAAILTAHIWGWLVITAALAGLAYHTGRRHSRRRPAVRISARRPAARRTVVTGRLSASCTRGDCRWCEDPRCVHDCGHPGILARPAPLPADDIPPF